jgi:hypothetical protein
VASDPVTRWVQVATVTRWVYPMASDPLGKKPIDLSIHIGQRSRDSMASRGLI